jgi:hypothetical protein
MPVPSPIPICNVPLVDSKCDDVTNAVAGAAGEAAAGVGSSMLGPVAEDFAAGAGTLMKTVVTWWLYVPTPAVDDRTGPATWVQSQLAWVTAVVAIFGLLVAAARMAWGGREAAQQAGQGLGRFVLTGALAIPVTAILVAAGDRFSRWVLSGVDEAALGEGLFQIHTAVPGVSQGVVLVLAIFAIIASIGQFFLLLARAALVPLLAGLLPTSAAASGTEHGMAAYKRHLAWLVAFVLYKPVAALVYAAAFRMLSGDFELGDLVQVTGTQLSGLAMIVLSLLVLPAMLRLVAPVMAQVAGGGGGAAAGAAGAAIATGAVVLSGGTAAPAVVAAGAGGGGVRPVGQPPTGGATPESSGGPTGGSGGTGPQPGTDRPPGKTGADGHPGPQGPSGSGTTGTGTVGAVDAARHGVSGAREAAAGVTGTDTPPEPGRATGATQQPGQPPRINREGR